MEENEKITDARIYELGFLLVPTIEVDNVMQVFADVKKTIEGKGGVFISEANPNLINLAYEMSRTIENKKTWFETGYFGWIKFEMEGAQAEELEAIFKRDERIIRFLLVKTVRENTLSSKKGPVFKKFQAKVEKTESTLEEKPMDAEEIDKEIDALIVDGEVV